MRILTADTETAACLDKRGTDAGYQRHRKVKEKACDECQAVNRARLAAWKSENPDRFARSHRNSVLKREFGITINDYELMLGEQGNACAICRRASASDGRRLAVDHDHKSGHVRGLLCTDCNVGLGKLGDDAARIQLAADYLRRGSR